MLKNQLNSFRYAFQGIARLVATQTNAKIHLVAAASAIGLGCWLHISTTEWCFVVIAISSVLAAEAFNTALEDLTDLVSPEQHPLAGHAKDLAAAAVLLTAMGAATVGALIFLPKLWELLV